MEAWKYAAFTIIGCVLISGSVMMGLVLRKLEASMVHNIHSRDIILLTTTVIAALAMLILGIRNLVRVRRNST